MSALRGFFEAMGFNKPELSEPPAPAPGDTPDVSQEKDAGGSGVVGAPGGGVYNPGDRNWSLIASNRSLQSSGHSAGAIRRGKKYDDYEGWQPRDYTATYNDNEHDIHVNFQI